MNISGFIKDVNFRNEKNGHTLFVLESSDLLDEVKSTLVNCSAKMPAFSKGFPLQLTGELKAKKDGYVFETTMAMPYFENTHMAEIYISSGIVKGIGPKLASRFVASIGKDLFNIINDRNIINRIRKDFSTSETALFEEFCWKTKLELQQSEIYTYIAPFGGDYLNAAKISEKRTNALHALKTNPYKVGIPAGLKFYMCDAIYAQEGGNYYDPCRIEAIAYLSILANQQNGNTFSYTSDILKESQRLTESSDVFKQKTISELIIRSCFLSKKIICEKANDGFRYYTKDIYFKEKSIVTNLYRLINASSPLPFHETLIEQIETKNNIKYAIKQKEAFNFLRSTGVKVLTGGPGTGKTTVINGLIQAYEMMMPGNEVLLCAPTGRAAQRLSEATGKPAQTLHKALDVKPYGDNETISKTLENPISAKCIIVDEMSMADTDIFSLLLGAVTNDTLLILCGDIDQLPSVGAGNILHDLLESGIIETNRLNVVYRQAQESTITINANKVNSGNFNLSSRSDFRFAFENTHEDMANTICDIVNKIFDKSNPFALQVLSSTKKGEAGTVELNKKLQLICNENTDKAECDYTFKINDKVMMLANNYDIGYVNGDIGTITNITSHEITINIKGTGIVNVPRNKISDVTLAYAITIHKSQGSEYDTVIISLPNNPISILKRNLLYTAITRAKKQVYIVTQAGVIQYTVKTLDTELRQTSILDKIISIPKSIF